MKIPASVDRREMERELRRTGQGNLLLYCHNGHSVGDEHMLSGARNDPTNSYRCPKCGVGKPWLYRWEVGC